LKLIITTKLKGSVFYAPSILNALMRVAHNITSCFSLCMFMTLFFLDFFCLSNLTM